MSSPPAASATPAQPGPLTRREALLSAGIALVAAALFTAPAFRGWGLWGINDWDQHQLYYGFPAWSILERGQWPFWNPYACGGNPGLANPQSPFLNPLFVLVLALGVLPGIKVLIWLHAALAIFAAWLLGRRMGCGRVAAWLPAAAFGLSSAYALHVATGHTTWFAMGFVALGLAALHEGFTRPRWGLAGGLAAAIALFIGNANLFAYLCLFAGLWAALTAIARRSWTPIQAVALMGLATIGFSAVKLLPLTDFMSKVTTPEVKDVSSGDFQLLFATLLGRAQDLTSHSRDTGGGSETLLTAMVWRWWEYGAYVGPAVLLLGLGYAARRIRQAWPLAALVALSLLIALGNGWGAWDILRHLPVFEGLRVPSRAVVFAALFLGILAGWWVTEWEGRFPWKWVAAGVGLVALDIGWVGQQSFARAFGVEPVLARPGPFRQVWSKKDFGHAWDHATQRYNAAYSDNYPLFLSNVGSVYCYDRLRLPRAVQPADDPYGRPNPAYRGEAWIEGGGAAEVAALGGRRIEVKVQPAAAGTLVVNQNFDQGWAAADGRAVTSAGGLLAAQVAPEDRTVVLVYTPPRFYLGAGITVATVLGSLGMALFRRRSGTGAGTGAGTGPGPGAGAGAGTGTGPGPGAGAGAGAGPSPGPGPGGGRRSRKTAV